MPARVLDLYYIRGFASQGKGNHPPRGNSPDTPLAPGRQEGCRGRGRGAAAVGIDQRFMESSLARSSIDWLMRKVMNSAGRTGATPISQVSSPASTFSGGLVFLSHRT